MCGYDRLEMVVIVAQLGVHVYTPCVNSPLPHTHTRTLTCMSAAVARVSALKCSPLTPEPGRTATLQVHQVLSWIRCLLNGQAQI